MKTTVGKALKIRYGKALTEDQRPKEGKYPVFGSAGEMSRTNSPLTIKPAVVVGRKGAIGKTHLMPEGGWSSDTTYLIDVPEGMDPRFVRYQLANLRLERFNSATTTPSLRRTDLEAQPFFIPSFEEQEHLSNFLDDQYSRLDAADRGLETARLRLRQLDERTIVSALTGGALDGQRVEFDLDDVGTEDGVLPALPEGWSWRRLSEIADVVGGITKDAGRQSDPNFVEVPYLRVANVQRRRLDLTDIKTIRVPQNKAESLRLEAGDVLMNEGGDRDKLARGWVWRDEIPDCIHQNHVFRARIKDNQLSPELLAWATNTIGGRWADRNGKQSVNLASISLSSIRKMPIPVPPLDDQPSVLRHVEEQLAASERIAAELGAQQHRSFNLRRRLLSAALEANSSTTEEGSDPMKELAHV